MRTKLRFTLSVLFALSMTIPAAAGGPLAVCTPGEPFLWGNGGQGIPFNPDQGPLGPLTNADAVQAVVDSFAAWEDVSTSSASYVNAGALPVDVDITNFVPYLNAPAPDGLSAIVFDDTGEIFDLLFGPGSGVLGFAGPEWGIRSTCTITEGLSFLNGPAFGNLTAAIDVMVHEFGHYSNLAHTVVNGQLYIGAGDTTGPNPFSPYPIPNPFTDIIETMYPFYFGPTVGTQTLEREDIAALSSLYPNPSFGATTASISGRVLAPNGSTPESGVNVIARNEADPFGDAVSAISGHYGIAGEYTLFGLTPGANYRVYIDELLAGGFSTSPQSPLPGPEEYYSGAAESSSDDPAGFVFVHPGASGIDIIFNVPQPGDPLAVGIDGFVQLPLPFEYELCGSTFDSVFVNANGNITFGTNSFDFTESEADFRNGPPRIAAWWDDLNVTRGGIVTYFQSSNDFTVVWDGVPEYFSTGSNSFSITISRSSDHVDFVYGEMTSDDGLAGVSCGGSTTSGQELAVDLSEFAPSRINLSNQPAMFERFFGSNDLAGSSVGFNGSTDYHDNWAENNDSLDKARNISLPFSSASVGRFTEIEPTGGDVDFYRFSVEESGFLLAEIANGALDSILVIADANGNVIAFDDDSGRGLLSRIATPVEPGAYFVGVSTFPDGDFSGDGNSGGRYVMEISVVDELPLSLGDDTFVELDLGFTFPFYGQNWTSVWVNSNGNLTFGSGDRDFSESVGEFLGDQPRIAPLWDDLNPSSRGEVTARWTDSSLTIRFVDVPQFFRTDSNNFVVTLHASGNIDMSWGAVGTTDAIVGTSPGGGAADPGEVDLSSSPTWSPGSDAVYEHFTFEPFDLMSSLISFF